jgi:hypothetical protein
MKSEKRKGKHAYVRSAQSTSWESTVKVCGAESRRCRNKIALRLITGTFLSDLNCSMHWTLKTEETLLSAGNTITRYHTVPYLMYFMSNSVANAWHFGTDPDPRLWLMDPDPATLVTDLQEANKIFFSSAYYFLKVPTFTSFLKIKSHKEVTKQ